MSVLVQTQRMDSMAEGPVSAHILDSSSTALHVDTVTCDGTHTPQCLPFSPSSCPRAPVLSPRMAGMQSASAPDSEDECSKGGLPNTARHNRRYSSPSAGKKRLRGGKSVDYRASRHGRPASLDVSTTLAEMHLTEQPPSLLPPKKRFCGQIRSALRQENATIASRKREKASVTFSHDAKLHDGHLLLHRVYEKVVMDFFAGVTKLSVATPVPPASSIQDAYSQTVHVNELVERLAEFDGRPLTKEVLQDVMASPGGHILAAWDRIERTAYGSKLDNFMSQYPLFKVACQMQGKSWEEVEHACFVAGLLGVDVETDGYNVLATMPGDVEHLLADMDASVASSVVGSSFFESGLALAGERRPGWFVSCHAHVLAPSTEGVVPSPIISPPPGYKDAINTLFHDPTYAAGNPYLLRGIQMLVEDLEQRLRYDILMHALRKYFGPTEDGETALSTCELESKVSLDEEEGLTDAAMARAHRLAYDADATTAAMSFREKQESVAVPILKEGGGLSCKLGPQHLLLVNQLKLVLRHAVRAFPAGF